jgi:hypothetical protein
LRNSGRGGLPYDASTPGFGVMGLPKYRFPT